MFGDICVDLISERRSKAKTLPLSKVCPLKITGSNFSSCLLFTINFFFQLSLPTDLLSRS